MDDREQLADVGSSISRLDRRIASLKQVRGQVQQQRQQQSQRQSGESDEAYAERMAAADRWYKHKIAEVVGDLEDVESRRTLYEKLVRLEESNVIPTDYVTGHVYLETSDNQKASEVYAAYIRLVESLGVEIVADGPPIVGSWIRNLLGGIARYLGNNDFEEKIHEVEHGLRLANIDLAQSEVDRNQAGAASELLNSCKDVSQCVFQIGSLILVKYVDVDGQTITVCRTLGSKEMMFLRDNPSIVNKPKKLIESLGILEHKTSDSH